MPKVAIVDSGVNPDHPHVRDRGTIVPGPTVTDAGPVASDVSIDTLGHGTAVAAAILDLAPGTEIYSVRVFVDGFECPFEHALTAFEVAIDWRPDVINLSLGTTSPEYCRDLTRLVDRATDAGIRVVAPASAVGLPSYPGSLERTDSVVADANIPREAPATREISGRTYWFASPHPRSIEDVPRNANWSGISFAAANVTAHLVKHGRNRH